MKPFFFLLLLAYVGTASAFQCSGETSFESLYAKAERVFLAYVTETRLEEELMKTLIAGYPAAEDESVKVLSAGYKVEEAFKGPSSSGPRLVDLLGIGTGYVGLTPGIHYIVFLPPPDPNLGTGFRMVNSCNVPLSHYRLNEAGFQAELERIRALGPRE